MSTALIEDWRHSREEWPRRVVVRRSEIGASLYSRKNWPERENRREWRDNEQVRENEKGKNELGVLKPLRERVFLSMH